MTERHAAVVVGAGPVGLALTLDLCLRGVDAVCVDERVDAAEGSRAICFAKRTLEYLHRLGAGERMVAKGVQWSTGRVYFGADEILAFDLLPETGHAMPAFINLQQYYVEEHLVDRLAEVDATALRRGVRVDRLAAQAAGVTLTLADGATLAADYVIACDGAKSPLREALGLPLEGHAFRDRFLITDVRMLSEFPPERRFWFAPTFHAGQSALLHKQPDDVWRIDLQLGWQADPERERRPERVVPRLQAMLGADARFEIVWTSVYAFQSRRIARFVHGRVLFAGDAAHQVSPFGARGANSGIQDAENLAWKLAAVLRHGSPPALLDTYGTERELAADENIAQSTRSTNFIAPQSVAARAFRDATLKLARDHAFARQLVNSGRLSVPVVLTGSTLNDPASAGPVGAVVPDAPVRVAGEDGWLLDQLGDDFTMVHFSTGPTPAGTPADLPPRLLAVGAGQRVEDPQGLAAQRLGAAPGDTILVRPDGHVCAHRGGGEAGLAACAAVTNAILTTGRAPC